MEKNGLVSNGRMTRSLRERPPTFDPGSTPKKTLLTRLGSAALEGAGAGTHYRLVVLGAEKVGKSAIIRQFLHGQFTADYSATVEELHRAEFDVPGRRLTLDILDTSGSHEFPAMRRLAFHNGDAFVVVYSIADPQSFEEAREIYDALREARPSGGPGGGRLPVVVVGNKADLARQVPREMAETVACCDWECGFVECSAKTSDNVVAIFDELLSQSNFRYKLSPAVERRRKSLPVNPVMSPAIHRSGGRLGKRNSCGVS